ncbi:MAG: linked oxidase [Chitinophagaceae bacterium]|nr:linked oxidase [Chitinophagaceae bacterium]
MTGTLLSPVVDLSQDEKLRNWAGNYIYSTDKLDNAKSVEEVQRLLKKYNKLKVLGTRHCFNGIADSKDHFISLSQFNKDISLDTKANTVTVASGVRYGELATHLYNNGFALHNLASLPHISVAGACATATHGSGSKNGNLATAVSGMEIVTAAGNIIHLSREKDGEQFSGAVVGLGGLGVVTKVTLDIQPAFMVRQDVYENMPLQQLEKKFDTIMSAGYSVSLFTDWQNKNFSEVWIKSRMDEGLKPEYKTEFFGAKPATKNLHPIVELSAENCTEQMGIPGPWHERLPHFRMGFTPSSGKELQSEYFVPRDKSYAAILAVQQLHEKITPHLMITEIRTIDADNLWMSPCYKQPSTTIHFTWKQDWPAVSRILPLIEAQLAPFNARPHWGKLFTMSPIHLKSLYKKLPDFLQLLKQYDPKGKFRNDFLSRNIYSS